MCRALLPGLSSAPLVGQKQLVGRADAATCAKKPMMEGHRVLKVASDRVFCSTDSVKFLTIKFFLNNSSVNKPHRHTNHNEIRARIRRRYLGSGQGVGLMNLSARRNEQLTRCRIIASSTGLLLKTIGMKVSAIKIDPYLNVDAGTMNPKE
jgi:hypothetical protein